VEFEVPDPPILVGKYITGLFLMNNGGIILGVSCLLLV
jgi:hypothetical protein